MKKATILLFLLIPVIIFCQNTHNINFKIIDSVVVKKRYPYATKVNLEVSVSDFQNVVFLYHFYNPVNSFRSKTAQLSLEYIIEDKNHEIIKPKSDTFSILYPYSVEDKRNALIGIFVNSKQKILSKKLNPQQKDEYNLAKQEINNPQQEVALYLLLSVYHSDLSKGEYYLYLTYSFNPGWQYVLKDITNDPRTFKGSVISNKVKLIVE